MRSLTLHVGPVPRRMTAAGLIVIVVVLFWASGNLGDSLKPEDWTFAPVDVDDDESVDDDPVTSESSAG